MNSMIKPMGFLALIVLLLSGLTSISTNSPELPPEATNNTPETNYSEWDDPAPESSELNISVKEGDKEDPGIWVSPGDHKSYPVADFTADPRSGVAPLTVTFKDLSSNAVKCSWDVDGVDGEDSNAPEFVHVYTEEGIYTVSLTVTNKDGSDTKIVVDCINVIANPSLSIVKLTDGYDVDDPSSYEVEVGSIIVWSYNVSNTGDVPLTDIMITDDMEGVIGTIASLGVGEYNNSFNASNISVAGTYVNNVTASTTYAGAYVNASDVSYYFGVNASIDIEAYTNGHDADEPTGPLLPLGSDVVWTYNVTNTGNVNLTGVNVQDNRFSGSLISTIHDDSILEPGEVWVYNASGMAEDEGYSQCMDGSLFVVLANVTASYNDKNVYDEDLTHYLVS